MTEELSSTVHRLFVVAYSTTACLAIMVSVSSGVVTEYWKDTIDGCILYADIRQHGPMKGNSATSFPPRNGNGFSDSNSSSNNGVSWSMTGSDLSVCHYVTFTPVFFIFICLLCLSYHLRHLFCKHCWRAEESEVKTDFWEMIVRVLVILSAIMALLALVVACVVTHGHDYTCSGLRQYVTSHGFSPWLGISSTQIHELFDRLDCGFFYSALDHGLKIGTGSDADDDDQVVAGVAAAAKHVGLAIIDSNGALEVAMATGWFQFFFWLALAGANLWLAQRLKVQMWPENLQLPALPAFFTKE